MSSEIIIHPTGSGAFMWQDTGTVLRPISFAIPQELANEFTSWIAKFRRLARRTNKGKRVSMTAIDNIGKELSRKLSLVLGDSVIIIYRSAFAAAPVPPPPPSRRKINSAKFVRDAMAFLDNFSPVIRRSILRRNVDIYRAGRRLPGHYGANQ